ncbi:hypothetical protein EH223_06170 [candidate division KSB1 bacterium]|nr:hypothetical protein [candidate division KSB1 bacterium]RQW05025.1 MAG: hypothetical protein EH223_06170 [candidate division KSB1 bacterium]
MFCFYACFLFGQNPDSDIAFMQQKLRAFDYNAVIEAAEKALANPDRYRTDQLINIHEMKAVAHYSKSELLDAKASFIEILKLDSLRTLDPIQTSPKIIEFFDTVKDEFEHEKAAETISPPEERVVRDTVFVVRQTLGDYKKSIPASLLFPGTGHVLMGEKKRGIIVTAISALTLSSAIYATDLTRRRENRYLSAINDADIAASYTPYNSAYKTRNALWTAFAAIWLYTQVDLIYFHSDRQATKLALQPAPDNSALCLVNLQIRF